MYKYYIDIDDNDLVVVSDLDEETEDHTRRITVFGSNYGTYLGRLYLVEITEEEYNILKLLIPCYSSYYYGIEHENYN